MKSNKNLTQAQVDELENILKRNKTAKIILERSPDLFRSNWYLVAGSVAQTVWNVSHNFDPEFGIKDYDLVYYDASDLSYEGEDAYIQKAKKLFKDVTQPIEIKNQARVHLWFKDNFGYEIELYKFCESAISTWATTAQCVGVRYVGGKFDVYAPYGLEDMFQMLVRPNNNLIFNSKKHEDKVRRWLSTWPKLKVVDK